MTYSIPRRITFACLVLLSFGKGAFAQDDLTVWSPADGMPRQMLSRYLLSRTAEHFDTRRQIVAALMTPEDLQRRQKRLRGQFIKAIGGFPEKTPLKPKVIAKVQGDGYLVEKVIYESRPHHHVTANLYLPEGKGPFPGVLVPCGHTSNGKIGYQRLCTVLVKHGFAVLCYDPIGQGERYQILTDPGKPVVRSTTEHTLTGVGALLVGRGTASYRIWDGIRSLDYLASRPEVDGQRLGCTGSSGGGTLTSYLMALDDRIKAAAPSCYITSLERLFATRGPQDAEQNITGQVAFGMEHADYISMRAPRPTLICASRHDFFDIQGTWNTFREAKQVYTLAGFSERVDLVESNTKHGFPRAQRQAMVRFMRRWLMGKDDPVIEDSYTLLKGDDLRCTRTGQVLEDLKGKSVFQLNLERAQEMAQQRQRNQANPKKLRKDVLRLLALPDTVKMADYKEIDPVERKGYFLVKVAFQTEPGITVPGLLFSPKKEDPVPLIIYLHGQGMAADSGVAGRCELLAKAGNRVLAIDLRGMGETSPRKPSTRPSLFGTDFKESFLGLHLNRPLLGQRIYDLLSVLEFVDKKVGKHISFIEIIGIGACGPIAWHAAALDPRIKRVSIEDSVVSWLDVVRTPLSYNQLTNAVPGALAVYDLPDLAALTVPKPVTIRTAIHPSGKPLSQEKLEESFEAARLIYNEANAKEQLIMVGARDKE